MAKSVSSGSRGITVGERELSAELNRLVKQSDVSWNELLRILLREPSSSPTTELPPTCPNCKRKVLYWAHACETHQALAQKSRREECSILCWVSTPPTPISPEPGLTTSEASSCSTDIPGETVAIGSPLTGSGTTRTSGKPARSMRQRLSTALNLLERLSSATDWEKHRQYRTELRRYLSEWADEESD